MPTFEVKVPVGANQIWLRQQIREAVAEATRRGKLRPNSVDSITGENSGDNLGPGTPIIHFEQWERDDIEVKLILKGGGCENTNAQYALPAELDHLGRADRIARRRAQVHPPRGVEGAGQGLQPRAPSASASAATARPATCTPRNSCSARSTTRTRIRGWRQIEAAVMDEANQLDRRPDGLRRQDVADRLQDRRAQPAAGELLRLGRLRLLGLPPPRRHARRARAARSRSWLYRDGDTPSVPMLPPEQLAAGLPAHRPRGPAAGADHRGSRSARSRSATSS